MSKIRNWLNLTLQFFSTSTLRKELGTTLQIQVRVQLQFHTRNPQPVTRKLEKPKTEFKVHAFHKKTPLIIQGLKQFELRQSNRRFCHPELDSGSHLSGVDFQHQDELLNQVQHDKLYFMNKCGDT